jgi:hypothetical protein
MRKTILIIVLSVSAVVAGLVYALNGSLGTPARVKPASLEQAMLDNWRDKPENADLGRLFDELNARHFSGRLPKAKVMWASDLDRLDIDDYRLNGMTDGKIILLKTALQDDEAEIRRTLCHEMIHVELIAEGHRSTAHDVLFQQELRRLLDDGCFEAIWATPEERAALKEWIDTERSRLDDARKQLDAQGASIRLETTRVERLIGELNEQIRIANAAGSGWPSRVDMEIAERQQAALNQSVLLYNEAVAANVHDQAGFNEAVQRYNLMLAYPDGLAEDRAKGLIR